MHPSPNLKRAHAHCFANRAEIEASITCACFSCLARYPSAAILQWTDDQRTAICPLCGADAVLGSAAGYDLSDTFLLTMRARYFKGDEST